MARFPSPALQGIYRRRPATGWRRLLLERSFHFQAAHNPYFRAHANAAFFPGLSTAISRSGRVTAQIDQLHQERYHDSTGHFGFIEAIDDPQVFQALLKTAEDWLRGEGMTRAVGPVSFSLWDQPGLLVKGFDNAAVGDDEPSPSLLCRARITACGLRRRPRT